MSMNTFHHRRREKVSLTRSNTPCLGRVSHRGIRPRHETLGHSEPLAEMSGSVRGSRLVHGSGISDREGGATDGDEDGFGIFHDNG